MPPAPTHLTRHPRREHITARALHAQQPIIGLEQTTEIPEALEEIITNSRVLRLPDDQTKAPRRRVADVEQADLSMPTANLYLTDLHAHRGPKFGFGTH